MKVINMKYTILGSIVILALTGCGQGFQSGKAASNIGSSNGGFSVDDGTSAELEKAIQNAEKAMADAEASVKDITDKDGNINISLFTTNSQNSQTKAQGLLAPIIDKLRGVFDKVFSKVEMAKQQFSNARGQLAALLAQIQQADPTNSLRIQELTAQLARLDSLEGQLHVRMQALAGRLDTIMLGIQKVVSRATSLIPGVGIIADILIDMFLMDDVRALIAEIKMRLLSI